MYSEILRTLFAMFCIFLLCPEFIFKCSMGTKDYSNSSRGTLSGLYPGSHLQSHHFKLMLIILIYIFFKIASLGKYLIEELFWI